MMMIRGDIVQFNKNHKWFPCFGFVEKVKKCGDDYRIMVGVPIPQEGTAFIFVMDSEQAITLVGRAEFMPKEEMEDEENK